MKHIVAISLVFFSLTHLAKAEQRVEGLRLLTEYCNKQQSNTQSITVGSSQFNDDQNPFFLSYSELTLIGILPSVKVAIHKVRNHIVADLTIRKNARNNSP